MNIDDIDVNRSYRMSVLFFEFEQCQVDTLMSYPSLFRSHGDRHENETTDGPRAKRSIATNVCMIFIKKQNVTEIKYVEM